MKNYFIFATSKLNHFRNCNFYGMSFTNSNLPICNFSNGATNDEGNEIKGKINLKKTFSNDPNKALRFKKASALLKRHFNGVSFTKSNLKIYNFPKRATKDQGKEKNALKEEKIIILEKTFSNDPNKPSKIVKSRKASDLVKQLNFENKHLFGPMLSSKKDPCSGFKLSEFNEIVQNKTEFPVSDSDANVKLKPPVEIPTNNNETGQTSHLNTILDFPLLNKSGHVKSSQTKLDEVNALRKYFVQKGSLSMPSVSAILEKTMPVESVEALARWKRSMIEELGEEGFEKHRAELLKRGSSLHANINSYLSATPEEDIHIDDKSLGHWQSLKYVFPKLTDIKLLEERVSHPFLFYKGIVDCFAKYRDQLVVIDWKTSKRTKGALSSTYDNPLQIAAYVGALNFDPKFQYLANKGLIVVAYESGSPANTLFINEENMLKYWKEWLKRVKLYWERMDSPQTQ